ncbi:MAG: LD-carboxypeptidase [Bacteroidota bacterium]
MQILKPPRLKKGDLIGIVAPAGPVLDVSKIDRGVRYLEQLGYHVAVGEHVNRIHGYLAGTDEERVTDLHSMFEDPRIKAIMAVRGGYGTTRILPLLNYRMIARHPKILVGFSDITALQLALWRKCRLITFHGPMLAADFADAVDSFKEEFFWDLVSSRAKKGKVVLPADAVSLRLHSGKATGRLLGGNLSLIVSVLGTPYQPDFTDSILFMEDLDEEPYRVDRMVTQLSNASVFEKSAGILAGQFTGCTPKDPTRPSFHVDEIMERLAEETAKPFLSNLPFGHIPRKMTLPTGLRARVNADAGEIEFLESAVS